MSDIKQAMKLIGGVEPSPQQVQRVQAIAHSLECAPNDPFMSILIALDTYHGVFSELPSKMQLTANRMAEGAEKQSRAAIDKSISESASTLAPVAEKAFAKGVERYCGTIERTAKEKSLGWAAKVGGLVLLGGLLLGGGFVTLAQSFIDKSALEKAVAEATAATAAKVKAEADAAAGIAAADARAELEVQQLRATAGWVGTKDGQLAKKFFDSGAGQVAATCNSSTWEVVKSDNGKWCIPKRRDLFGGDENKYGWKIP